MDVAVILTRLVAAAKTAVSTPARTITAFDYVPDDFEAPAIYPAGVKTNFDETFNRGTDKIAVRLRMLCARTDDREGQHMLYGYLKGSGASSIKAAIEAARGLPGVGALGGACDDLRVTDIGEARWFEHAGNQYVGADFTVEIWGSGS
jgi:hypothetical protein